MFSRFVVVFTPALISAYLFGALLIFACASPQSGSKKEPMNNQKLDAPLKLKLASASGDEEIQVLGKCSRPITDEMRKEMESAGIKVQSVIGDIFTAWCPAKQVRKLAAFDFVIQLELSVEAHLKH